MYLTAQRVVSPASGQTGINTYCYSHGLADWSAPPDSILDDQPGELIGKVVEVTPPGNRVRSFLDIAMPDAATTEELGDAFEAFIEAHRKQNFPWTGVQNRCAFRLGMDQSLAVRWRAELAELLRALAKTLNATEV